MVQVSYTPWGRSLRYYTPRAFGTRCINRVATSPSSYNLYFTQSKVVHKELAYDLSQLRHSQIGCLNNTVVTLVAGNWGLQLSNSMNRPLSYTTNTFRDRLVHITLA